MFYSILQHRDRDQDRQNRNDAELEAARQEADSFSFGLKREFTNTRRNVMQATDEILMVGKVIKDGDGTWCVKCPHCKQIIGLADGPIRGEQFHHKTCGGWLEVSHSAKAELP